MPVDYDAARALLDETFRGVEADLLRDQAPTAPAGTAEAFQRIFDSATQAYREAIMGCVLARSQDKSINIRLPYINLGANAFNGRSLDEEVVNPFLQRNRIPSSRGPYLAKFRLSVRFDESTNFGTRDVEAYTSFRDLLAFLEGTDDDGEIQGFLHYLLFLFARLREASVVAVSRLPRISLEQYDAFIRGLMEAQSGGRIPVLQVVAALTAIRDYFGLDWGIECQGINVADAAAGAGGDITVRRGGQVVFSAEVTERIIDRNRVVSTFNAKIAPNEIQDYLFFIRTGGVAAEAQVQARQYFTQGYEVNFLEIRQWILMTLATIGIRGRDAFNRSMISLIDAPDMPRSVKVKWNEQIERLVAA